MNAVIHPINQQLDIWNESGVILSLSPAPDITSQFGWTELFDTPEELYAFVQQIESRYRQSSLIIKYGGYRIVNDHYIELIYELVATFT